MNENQMTYPSGAEEEEIDLVALMVTLLHKTKPILLTALACAVIFGGVAGIKAVKGGNADAQATYQQEMEEYRQKKQDYESAQTLYEQNVKSNDQEQKDTAEAMKQAQEYAEKSVLNNLDPYNVWTAQVDLYVSTGYQIMPGMAYQNPDRTNSVLAAYMSALNDGAALNEIAAQFGTQAQYLRELVSVNYSIDTRMLTIVVTGKDQQTVDGIMDAMLARVDAAKENISNTIGSHSITIIARSSYSSVSTDLRDQQKANSDQIVALENQAEDLQAARQQLDDNFQTATDEWNNTSEPVLGSGMASTLVKYLLIGFLVGGVLACGVYTVKFLMGGMVYSSNELSRSTGLPVLGALASDRTRKAGKLDAKLNRMEGRPDGSTDAEMLCLMAQTIRSRAPEAQNILVTGDLPGDQLEALAAALQATDALRSQKVTAAESILKTAATVPHVVAADAIVLAVDCTITHTSSVREQNEKIARLGKKILGCVVYE